MLKFYYIFFLIPVFLFPVYAQSDYEQVISSSDNTLDIGFYTIPPIPNVSDKTTLKIDFINPSTKKIQEHVDYTVKITKDNGRTNVFGPTSLIHTSEGDVKIPVQFQQEGMHDITITMEGILFQPIPVEIAVIPLMVGQDPKTETNTTQNSDDNEEMGGGGCLIATAAYGTELSPQVQFLREIRDNTVMSTAYGISFMTGFNSLYYSFSPTIANLERENPIFKDTVRAFITPMISTLSIMTLAENGNDVEVLGLGISVIALNFGMYIATPIAMVLILNDRIKLWKSK